MPTKREETIKRFLYGEMPEDERFDFEEKFIADAELFAEIESSENDLIEKYVREWMNPAERKEFEQKYLVNEKRREKVETTKLFLQKIDEQRSEIEEVQTAEVSETESVWDKFAAFLLTPKYALGGAFAILLAVFGAWFLSQSFESSNEQIVKNQNDNTEVREEEPIKTPDIPAIAEPKINENTDSDNELTNENKNTQTTPTPTRTPLKERIIEKPKTTPTPRKTPVERIVPRNPVLALFAGTVRSEGKNKILKIPANAKNATLQLNLESADYKTYQAQLQDAEGNVIFQNVNLKIRNKKVNFRVPTANLANGDYLIALSGKNEAGEKESVADFQFRVER